MSATLLARFACDDDAATTDVVDASGNGLHGTATANTDTLSVAAKLGDGLNLAGSYYVDLPSGVSSGLDGVASATFLFWIKRLAINARHDIFDITRVTTFSKINIIFNSDNTIRAGGRSDDESFQYVSTTGTFTDTASFHLLAVRYYLPDDEIKIWFDGVLQETTGSPSFTNNAFEAAVGTSHTLGYASGANIFNGVIDETRIYTASTKLLTPGNIGRLWSGGAGTVKSLAELYAENTDNRLALPLAV